MEMVKSVNAALHSLWEFYLLEYLIRAGSIITGLLNISRVNRYGSDVFYYAPTIPLPLKFPQISSFLKQFLNPFYFTIQPCNC